MCTKCVLTVPLNTVDSDITFNLKKNYWPYKKNDVYKMCNERSSYYSRLRFFHKLEKNYWPYKRNDVQNVFSPLPLLSLTQIFPSS